MMRHLGLGLRAIHNMKIVHRDVKPDNIVKSRENWKICDFGSAYFHDELNAYIYSLFTICSLLTYISLFREKDDSCCTQWFKAPEMDGKTGYDYKIDW